MGTNTAPNHDKNGSKNFGFDASRGQSQLNYTAKIRITFGSSIPIWVNHHETSSVARIVVADMGNPNITTHGFYGGSVQSVREIFASVACDVCGVMIAYGNRFVRMRKFPILEKLFQISLRLFVAMSEDETVHSIHEEGKLCYACPTAGEHIKRKQKHRVV